MYYWICYGSTYAKKLSESICLLYNNKFFYILKVEKLLIDFLMEIREIHTDPP